MLNLRIDEDDVGHRQERGDAGDDLGARLGAVLAEAEIAVEYGSGPGGDGCSTDGVAHGDSPTGMLPQAAARFSQNSP